MSIKPLGEALLARSERREKAQRDRNESFDFGDLFKQLLPVGLKVIAKSYNETLSDRLKNFQQTEPYLAQQAAARMADKGAAAAIETQNKIDKTGLGALDYFTDLYKSSVKENILAQYSDLIGDSKQLDAIATQGARVHAKKAVENHKNLMAMLGGVSEGNYENVLDATVRENHPTTVGQKIIGSISRQFSGKSKEELEEEFLLAMKENTEDVEEFNKIYKMYKQGVSLVGAIDYSNVTSMPNLEEIVEKIKEAPRNKESREAITMKIFGEEMAMYKITVVDSDGNFTERLERIGENEADRKEWENQISKKQVANIMGLAQTLLAKDSPGFKAFFSKAIADITNKDEEVIDKFNLNKVTPLRAAYITEAFSHVMANPGNFGLTDMEQEQAEIFGEVAKAMASSAVGTQLDAVLDVLMNSDPDSPEFMAALGKGSAFADLFTNENFLSTLTNIKGTGTSNAFIFDAEEFLKKEAE